MNHRSRNYHRDFFFGSKSFAEAFNEALRADAAQHFGKNPQLMKKHLPASIVEDLVYSKVHNTYCTNKEFPYLHQLLTLNVRKYTGQVVTEVSPNTSTTTQSPIDTSPSQANSAVRSGGNPSQDQEKGLRNMLVALLKKEPYNKFYQSLSTWRNNFTFKQGLAIKKGYDANFPNTNSKKDDETKDWASPEEANDPKWTPWD